jgi:ABC-type sugar transport system permease subunit
MATPPPPAPLSASVLAAAAAPGAAGSVGAMVAPIAGQSVKQLGLASGGYGGQKIRWAPYLFVAPFVLIFCTFTLYPLLQSVVLSMQQTFGPRSTVFVGTRNYRFLLSDPMFWLAVRNTAVFAATSIFIQLPLSLGLAMLLNRPSLRGRTIFRLIFFSPSLVGLVFVAIVALLAFDKHTGLVDVTLHRVFGFNQDFPWLDSYVMLALVLTALWVYVGFNMVYFLAALQNVSRDLTEAAMVDGATAWHRFLHVTVPAIRPVASFVVLLSLIGSFQLFELPYVLLNFTGGADNQGLTVVMYLYLTGFQTGDLGYASAIGWLLAIFLGGFALLHTWLGSGQEAEAA